MNTVEQSNSRSEFLAGARAELPILLGVAPFGLIYGAVALAAGLPVGAAQAMSSIVFAGSSQFMAVKLIETGTPLTMILVSIFIINLRHALYSASIAPYLQKLSLRWKGLLAYLVTDEVYVVAVIHYSREGSQGKQHWYFLGAGLALWLTWQISTAVGILVGTQVPANWPLDFALALTFIALLVPGLKDRAGVLAALSAGITAVAGNGLPYKLGLVLAAVVGIVVGLWSERK